MRIAIMQPYFLPYIGYFQLINSVDFFVVYDDVNYIKKGWINRNNILVNEKPFLFNIPIQNASQNRLINELSILDLNKWKIDFLKTIKMSYIKAPFYDDVYPIIEKIISFKELNLAAYIQNSIELLCLYLTIGTKFVKSSEIVKNNDNKGEKKIIDICVNLKATDYINAIGGLDLYTKEHFLSERINLKFLRPEAVVYKQFKNEFIPWLSIIDIIMFNSIDDTLELLDKYELVT